MKRLVADPSPDRTMLQGAPRIRLRDPAASRVRYGSRRRHVWLRRAGWRVTAECGSGLLPPARMSYTAARGPVRSGMRMTCALSALHELSGHR